MKTHRLVQIRRVVAGVAIAALAFTNVQMAVAATLTTPRIYLNRQKINLGAADGVQYDVFFTVVTGITNGKVKINFPTDNTNDDTKWCRTAGSDLVVTGIANPAGATETATALPGTLAGSCSQSDDQIVVTFTGAVSAGKYGVRIANGSTAKLGTGAGTPPRNDVKVTLQTTTSGDVVQDSSTLAISLISDDQVLVSALVDVTLSVSLDVNSIALGTLSTANVYKGAATTTVSTSAANGYISLVKYDQTLTSTTGATIGGVVGGTIAAGESEYGAASSQSGNTIGQWSPASCTTGASTSNAYSLSTTFQDYASKSTAATNDATTLCIMAGISGTQAPGTYTSTATLVTTARF